MTLTENLLTDGRVFVTSLPHLAAFSLFWFGLLTSIDLASFIGRTLARTTLIRSGLAADQIPELTRRVLFVELRCGFTTNLVLLGLAWLAVLYYHTFTSYLAQAMTLVALNGIALTRVYLRELPRRLNTRLRAVANQ